MRSARARPPPPLHVEEHHTNGHDICHGGYIFTLAEFRLRLCLQFLQSHRGGAAQTPSPSSRPGRLGDRLTAQAQEIARYGRSGIYDVRRERPRRGRPIAEFRGGGPAPQIDGKHFGGVGADRRARERKR